MDPSMCVSRFTQCFLVLERRRKPAFFGKDVIHQPIGSFGFPSDRETSKERTAWFQHTPCFLKCLFLVREGMKAIHG